MATIEAAARPRVGVDGPFYLIMSLVLAGIVVFGFAQTVPGDFAAPNFPALLWVHGAAFAAWVLLFVAQPALIWNRSFRIHRVLGWIGLALACVMVVLGASAILFGLWSNALPEFYPPGLFLVRGAAVLLLFAGLLFAALLQRHRREWHKRLMLCAAIIVIDPGLERALPVSLFGSYWPFLADGVLDVIALAGPAVDFMTRRRVHPAYLWGVGAIVAGQLAVDLVAPSGLATFLLRAVGAGGTT